MFSAVSFGSNSYASSVVVSSEKPKTAIEVSLDKISQSVINDSAETQYHLDILTPQLASLEYGDIVQWLLSSMDLAVVNNDLEKAHFTLLVAAEQLNAQNPSTRIWLKLLKVNVLAIHQAADDMLSELLGIEFEIEHLTDTHVHAYFNRLLYHTYARKHIWDFTLDHAASNIQEWMQLDQPYYALDAFMMKIYSQIAVWDFEGAEHGIVLAQQIVEQYDLKNSATELIELRAKIHFEKNNVEQAYELLNQIKICPVNDRYVNVQGKLASLLYLKGHYQQVIDTVAKLKHELSLHYQKISETSHSQRAQKLLAQTGFPDLDLSGPQSGYRDVSPKPYERKCQYQTSSKDNRNDGELAASELSGHPHINAEVNAALDILVAKAYVALGRHNSALPLLEGAKTVFIDRNDHYGLFDANLVYFDIFYHQKDIDSLYEQVLKMTDFVTNYDDKLARERSKRAEKIATVKEQVRALWHSEQQLKQQNRTLVMLSVFCLVLVALFAWLVFLLKKVRILANTDGLTRIANRRYGLQRAQKLLARNSGRYRSAECLAIAILDLDHFKSINDSYGHDAGDQVLIRTVNTVKQHIDNKEVFCRLGGEEFLVVMRANSIFALENRLADIRQQVNLIDVLDLGITKSISTSIGVSLRTDSQDKKTISEHIIQADNALYDAKDYGRNRVCFYLPKQQCT